MVLIARCCEWVSVEVLFNVGQDYGQSPWWSSALGWIVFIWLSKKSAAAGWWRVEGAKVFAVLSLMFCSYWALRVDPGTGLGWFVASLWACSWPLARAALIDQERKKIKAEVSVGLTKATGDLDAKRNVP